MLQGVLLSEVGPMLQRAYLRERERLANLVRVTHTAEPEKLLETLKPPKMVDAQDGWATLATDFGRPDVAEKIRLHKLANELRKKRG